MTFLAAGIAASRNQLAGFLLLLAILGIGLDSHRPLRADEPSAPDAQDTVRLVIVVGEEKLELKPLELDKQSSVIKVMIQIAETDERFSFEYRGKRSTVFITEINERKNEGGNGRNWVYYVNGKRGDRSAGLMKVEPGDEITWKFETYR